MDKLAEADLARSGISVEQADRAGIFEVPNAQQIYKDFRPLPALVIPYFDIDGGPLAFQRNDDEFHFCRVRYLKEDTDGQPLGFVRSKPRRYDQPERGGVHAYFPMSDEFDWSDVAEDVSEPIVITEGEKKALAGTLANLPTIGLGGVYNFLVDGKLLPELEAFEWKGRDVYLCYDSDAALNPQIQAAEARLVDELMRERGANMFLVRMPADGEQKVGLDDYLVKNGFTRLANLLESVPPLGALDAAVVALNQHVAWIERDGAIYDLKANHFIRKEDFKCGSQYSSLKVRRVVTKGRNPGFKEVPVAAEWLTHAHAQRYGDLLFRPNEPETLVTDNGGVALNAWSGWQPKEGDVAPFLELSEFLFSKLPASCRDLPLKLMAYKAQHPEEKIPLAPVLIGTQGCGKSLWGECIRDAFSPYGTELSSSSLNDPFQGWLERTLIAVINEADAEDIIKGRDRLKALISDLTRPMNEKYRPSRQINTYTLYILTSNSRRVGAYSADDRRMIVVNCPPKREYEFYQRVGDWRKNQDGPKKLLNWLLNYDLEGWEPPAAAPMTAEKHMAYIESLTPVQRIAEDMKTGSQHAIKLWIDQSLEWARSAELGNDAHNARLAKEIIDSMGVYPVRPWYTAAEITRLFPAMSSTLHGNRRGPDSVGEVSRQLREAGIPYLECADDPRGFRWKGQITQFLIVSDPDDWAEPIKQDDFDRLMKQWPTYKQIVSARSNNAKA